MNVINENNSKITENISELWELIEKIELESKHSQANPTRILQLCATRFKLACKSGNTLII